ncbi:hypothetical protein [Deinococcus sp. Arct2-2]|nr:hypothetical protein [Deinococcus sp. Arct2-2]
MYGTPRTLNFSYADLLSKQVIVEASKRIEADGQTSAICAATLNQAGRSY